MVDAQWVNAGFLNAFGWEAPNDFTRADLIDRLARTQARARRRSVPRAARAALQPAPRAACADRADAGRTRSRGRRSTATRSATTTPARACTSTSRRPSTRCSSAGPKAISSTTAIGPDGRVTRFDEVPLQAQPEHARHGGAALVHGRPVPPRLRDDVADAPASRCTAKRFACANVLRRCPSPITDRGSRRPSSTSSDGPLFWNGPGDITRWMAVPWQTDTASCRAGYRGWPGNPLPKEIFIPSFWPSRVPNDVLTEEDFAIVVDAQVPLDERMHAFYRRVRWLRSFDYNGPYIPQITRMITEFGELGVVEARENPNAGGRPVPARVLRRVGADRARARAATPRGSRTRPRAAPERAVRVRALRRTRTPLKSSSRSARLRSYGA